MPDALNAREKLLKRLDAAGGQGLALDRLDTPLHVTQSLVRSGRAHISFGRIFVTRRLAYDSQDVR